MTEWKIVMKGSSDTPTLVEPLRSYELKPGDCHVYEAGAVQSLSSATKLIRVEG